MGASQPTGSAWSKRYDLWLELIAVLAIGVLPPLSIAIAEFVQPSRPLPYWLDSLNLIVKTSSVSFALLFLLRACGYSWAQFGIVKPRFGDVFWAVLLLGAVELLWKVSCHLLPMHELRATETLFPVPRIGFDLLLMVLKYASNGFSEELVCRACLITRLQLLTGSRTAAIVVSSACFAAYHLYYGGGWGLAYFFFVGVVFGISFMLIRRIFPLALGHTFCDIVPELRLMSDVG